MKRSYIDIGDVKPLKWYKVWYKYPTDLSPNGYIDTFEYAMNWGEYNQVNDYIDKYTKQGTFIGVTDLRYHIG